jgi:hypothetical protein
LKGRQVRPRDCPPGKQLLRKPNEPLVSIGRRLNPLHWIGRNIRIPTESRISLRTVEKQGVGQLGKTSKYVDRVQRGIKPFRQGKAV